MHLLDYSRFNAFITIKKLHTNYCVSFVIFYLLHYITYIHNIVYVLNVVNILNIVEVVNIVKIVYNVINSVNVDNIVNVINVFNIVYVINVIYVIYCTFQCEGRCDLLILVSYVGYCTFPAYAFCPPFWGKIFCIAPSLKLSWLLGVGFIILLLILLL